MVYQNQRIAGAEGRSIRESRDSDGSEEEAEDMWGAELGQDETHGSGQIELTF